MMDMGSKMGARVTARSRRNSKGMTLIEILFALAIISLMFGMVLGTFSSGKAAKTSRAVNQLSATIRFAYDKSRVSGIHMRLAINFEQRSFSLQQANDAMYMPATNRDGERVEFDADAAEDQAARDERAADNYNRSLQAAVYGAGQEDDLDPYSAKPKTVPRRRPPLFDSFDADNTVSGIGEPIVLPEGVNIVSVRTEHDFEPITEGEAYLYFFPQGRTQMAHIQVEDKDGKNQYTIIIQPLTGRVTIVPEIVDLELPDDINEGEDDLGNKENSRTF